MLDYLLGAGSSKFYPKTGPGPIELLAGSEEAGFFGEVSSSELFTSQELASQVRLLSEGTPSVTFPTWLKFFHRAKVLFIAKDLKFGSFSWTNQAGTYRLFPGYLNKVSWTTSGYWRPVLELVS